MPGQSTRQQHDTFALALPLFGNEAIFWLKAGTWPNNFPTFRASTKFYVVLKRQSTDFEALKLGEMFGRAAGRIIRAAIHWIYSMAGRHAAIFGLSLSASHLTEHFIIPAIYIFYVFQKHRFWGSKIMKYSVGQSASQPRCLRPFTLHATLYSKKQKKYTERPPTESFTTLELHNPSLDAP